MIYLTINSCNIDLLDYFITSLSYPEVITTIVRTLSLKKIDGVDTCLGSVLIGNTTEYIKKENQCFECSIVTDETLINHLDYFNASAITIPTTNIISENESYQCNSYLSINGRPYYILI